MNFDDEAAVRQPAHRFGETLTSLAEELGMEQTVHAPMHDHFLADGRVRRQPEGERQPTKRTKNLGNSRHGSNLGAAAE
ncbi:hypothetical protein [Mesorhizobium sp.]|uniref:hypothetical protein n=1 Tax=Mesorhizobium sp. TaxID=1871066 RepID=UPI00257E064A|nr:hypothetical protein [Mesorhizobium sp.]